MSIVVGVEGDADGLHGGNDAGTASKEDDCLLRAKAADNVEPDVGSTEEDVLADSQAVQVVGHLAVANGADVEAQRAGIICDGSRG